MAKKYNFNFVNMVKLDRKIKRSLYYEVDTRLTTAESTEEKSRKIEPLIGDFPERLIEDDEVLYEESPMSPNRITFTI